MWGLGKAHPPYDSCHTWLAGSALVQRIKKHTLVTVASKLDPVPLQSRRQAAVYVLAKLQASSHSLQAVCFYEPAQRGFFILDASGRCLPRHASPLAERDAFVLYDDARCRGADLQLGRGAVGLLTLAPGITKDKVCGQWVAAGGLGAHMAAVQAAVKRASCPSHPAAACWPLMLPLPHSCYHRR